MKPEFFKRYELLFLLGLLLALTLPFIGQAIHHDAQQWIDFAKMELEHPLWHHLQDYDYFGTHYPGTDYHDTHPRLQSLYLSAWLAITGSLSEPLLHLEMLVFPIIAVVAMYFLARRFKVNAFIATLLFLVAPVFIAANHLIMIDIPGLAFWLAAMAFYIKGVDADKILYLLAGALSLTLAFFTYYQDLSLLPLLLLYLLLFRKVKPKTVVTLSIPLVLFLAFAAAHYAYYGQPPNFTYNTVEQPMDIYSIIIRFRGTIALIGGVIIFPIAVMAIFSRIRWINIVAMAVMVITVVWSLVYYLIGWFSADNLLLLPWMMAAGVMVLFFILRKFVNAAPLAIINAGGRDDVILCVWFLGVFFYNCILLPYPSTRYLLPLVPPLVIYATKEIEKLWGLERRRLRAATAIIAGLTLVLTLGVAVGEHQRANEYPIEADWVVEHYPPNGHVWFNGGLGFQYYMEQRGYKKMALIDGEGIQKGDYIVESRNNRWYFDKDFLYRLELVDQVDFPRRWPVVTEYLENRTSWLGRIGLVIPYGFEGDNLDRLYVYMVALDEEKEYACTVIDQ